MSKPYKYVKLSDNGHAIIEVKTRLGLYYENAFRGPSLFVKRIVSCLNACEGIEDPADLRKQRDELVEALNECDKAFACWQIGQIPGRPEDILKLINKVRQAIARCKEGKK